MTPIRLNMEITSQTSSPFNLSRSPSLAKIDNRDLTRNCLTDRKGSASINNYASPIPSNTVIIVPKSCRDRTLQIFLSKQRDLREDVSPPSALLKISKQAITDIIKKQDTPAVIQRMVETSKKNYEKKKSKRRVGSMFINDLWSKQFEAVIKKQTNIEEELKMSESQRRKPLNAKLNDATEFFEHRSGSSNPKGYIRTDTLLGLRQVENSPVFGDMEQYCESEVEFGNIKPIDCMSPRREDIESSGSRTRKVIPRIKITRKASSPGPKEGWTPAISTALTLPGSPSLRDKLGFESPRLKWTEDMGFESVRALKQKMRPMRVSTEPSNLLSDRSSKQESPIRKIGVKKPKTPMVDLKGEKETLESLMTMCAKETNRVVTIDSARVYKEMPSKAEMEKKRKEEEKRRNDLMEKCKHVVSLKMI